MFLSSLIRSVRISAAWEVAEEAKYWGKKRENQSSKQSCTAKEATNICSFYPTAAGIGFFLLSGIGFFLRMRHATKRWRHWWRTCQPPFPHAASKILLSAPHNESPCWRQDCVMLRTFQPQSRGSLSLTQRTTCSLFKRLVYYIFPRPAELITQALCVFLGHTLLNAQWQRNKKLRNKPWASHVLFQFTSLAARQHWWEPTSGSGSRERSAWGDLTAGWRSKLRIEWRR